MVGVSEGANTPQETGLWSCLGMGSHPFLLQCLWPQQGFPPAAPGSADPLMGVHLSIVPWHGRGDKGDRAPSAPRPPIPAVARGVLASLRPSPCPALSVPCPRCQAAAAGVAARSRPAVSSAPGVLLPRTPTRSGDERHSP